ncbi:unnamed protein product [Trifolium pratense]|uniref:Uncharacterized protein n=1 Tax=Trifolium pratense TaxID=57577 RepID=A0ACB0IQG4_TRIPR|nr:unnamed protein product [Trifolium pratense]
MKLIDELALDEMLAGVLSEARDMEDRFSKDHLQDLLAIVSGINKEAQDALEEEINAAIGVGEASTSGHQGSSEAQDSHAKQDEIMTKKGHTKSKVELSHSERMGNTKYCVKEGGP